MTELLALWYLKQTAEGSTDVHVDSVVTLSLHLVDRVHKLLQYLHSEEHKGQDQSHLPLSASSGCCRKTD